MKKAVITVIVLAVLAGVGVYFYQHNQAKAPADTTGQQTNQNQPSSDNTAQNPTAATSTNSQVNVNGSMGVKAGDGGEPPAPNIQVVEVGFDGSQFSPKTVNINSGDWVFFKNNSSMNFWPASDPHPQHTGYPGFDALKPIGPGGEYKFQFTKVGTWGYHDHLHAFIQGTVVVK